MSEKKVRARLTNGAEIYPHRSDLKDILPCPFCGSNHVSHSVGEYGDGSDSYYIECQSCAATADGGGHGKSTKQGAIQAWNTRADLHQKQQDANLQGGMDLRDWFAGMAMQGFISIDDNLPAPQDIAEFSYTIADAMLEARKK